MAAAAKLAADKVRDLTEIEQIIFPTIRHHRCSPTTRATGCPASSPSRKSSASRATSSSLARSVNSRKTWCCALRCALFSRKPSRPFGSPCRWPRRRDLLLRHGASDDQPRRPGAQPDEGPELAHRLGARLGRDSLQGFEITLREVESLAPGDLLLLDQKKCENAVGLARRPGRFAGRLTREAHKTTVTIVQPLE